MFLFYTPDIATMLELPQEEAAHAIRVLRLAEGDFSPEEVQLAIQHGFRPITLGRSRLRTETAALVAVHVMNLTHS